METQQKQDRLAQRKPVAGGWGGHTWGPTKRKWISEELQVKFQPVLRQASQARVGEACLVPHHIYLMSFNQFSLPCSSRVLLFLACRCGRLATPRLNKQGTKVIGIFPGTLPSQNLVFGQQHPATLPTAVATSQPRDFLPSLFCSAD